MFINQNTFYHIGKKNLQVKEGGLARDVAIYHCLKPYASLINIGDKKVLNIFKTFYFLLFSRNNKIFIHYPPIGIPISEKYLILKFIKKLFNLLFIRAQNNNCFYIDISDMPLEQAKDLALNIPYHYKDVESIIFNNKSIYFFASSSMKRFAIQKYNLSPERCNVWINGGNEVSTNDKLLNLNVSYKIKEQNIKFVYAGTLNKGRQIETLIKIFSKYMDKNLILIGTGGEWIRNINLTENIFYLGAFEENTAHNIVSQCDIGLIPYDSDKFYYNIAYPTKLSFYITAGITFLSTDVDEVISINKDYDIGFVRKIHEWEQFIATVSKDDLLNDLVKINKNKQYFLWSNIIDVHKSILNAECI